jgi:hypothetical protein
MNVRHVFQLCVVTAFVTIGTGFGWGKAIAAQDSRKDVEEGVEVLTRGPVHEAFAETVTFDPESGIVVSKAPPESIEELPPEQRPAGTNVDWIPGYWAWDDERDDFLWVSGVWRALPPGREWVSGYWGRAARGFQWTPGYWADSEAREIEYLPEPPETVEVGPNLPSPSADHSWIPGSWVWHQGRYAWRPGYWVTVRTDWDWTPAHYVWAPRGYVFVDGYWDYSVDRRGVLFAPVYFAAGVYTRPHFHYSPVTVIDLAVFSDHLFLRPRYHHYYFGDYYAANYHDAGFYASFSFHSGQRGYDPIYAEQRWRNRQDPEWGRRVEANFSFRRDNEDARPRRTLAAQISFSTSDVKSRDRSLVVATSLDQLARNKDSRLRFQPLDQEERQKLTQRGKEVQIFREERHKRETTAADTPAEKPPKERGPTRVTLRRSPIVAKPVAELGKDDAPPQRPEPPKPDPKVEPKPRKSMDKRERPGKP